MDKMYKSFTISELYDNWRPGDEYYISTDDLIVVEDDGHYDSLEIPFDKGLTGRICKVLRVEKECDDLYYTYVENLEGTEVALIDDDIAYVLKPVN